MRRRPARNGRVARRDHDCRVRCGRRAHRRGGGPVRPSPAEVRRRGRLLAAHDLRHRSGRRRPDRPRAGRAVVEDPTAHRAPALAGRFAAVARVRQHGHPAGRRPRHGGLVRRPDGGPRAGFILLAVYLREVDFLYAQAEATAEDREARRAELERARDNLDLALEAAEMGDWELDLRANTSRRSPRHDAILGHREPVAEWDVKTFLGQVVPEDRDAVRVAFDAAVRTGLLDIDCRIRRADDGTTRSVKVLGKVYRDETGQPRSMAGVVMDTTRQREAEERLNQSQKMEAIGQLTGGCGARFQQSADHHHRQSRHDRAQAREPAAGRAAGHVGHDGGARARPRLPRSCCRSRGASWFGPRP